MANTGQKTEINLINSLNVDTLNENIYSFENKQAPLIENTGIERLGGITNIYQTVKDFGENKAFLTTENGKDIVIQQNLLDENLNDVFIDGKNIGQVSKYGLQSKTNISNVDDVLITCQNTYITLNLNGTETVLKEYSVDTNELLNTRTNDFINISNYIPFFTSISFVRYSNPKFADSQEFALRIGDQLVILQERNTIISINPNAFGTEVALGFGNSINCSIIYKNTLVVAGDNGRLASFDGSNWKNYNGSGNGTGIYSESTVLGTAHIYAMIVYNNQLIVAGGAGRLASYDGLNWRNYDNSGVGTGIYNNSTVIGNGNILTLAIHENNLIVAGTAGRMGSYNGTTWTNYNVVGNLSNKLACDGLLGGNSIKTVSVKNSLIALAGEGGRVGSTTPLNNAFTTGQLINTELDTYLDISLSADGIVGASKSSTTTTGMKGSYISRDGNLSNGASQKMNCLLNLYDTTITIKEEYTITSGGSTRVVGNTTVEQATDFPGVSVPAPVEPGYGTTISYSQTLKTYNMSQMYCKKILKVGDEYVGFLNGLVLHSSDGITFKNKANNKLVYTGSSPSGNTNYGVIGNDFYLWFAEAFLTFKLVKSVGQMFTDYVSPTLIKDADNLNELIYVVGDNYSNSRKCWYSRSFNGITFPYWNTFLESEDLIIKGVKCVNTLGKFIAIGRNESTGQSYYWLKNNPLSNDFGARTALPAGFKVNTIESNGAGFVIIGGDEGKYIYSKDSGVIWSSVQVLSGWTYQNVLSIGINGNTVVFGTTDGKYSQSFDSLATFSINLASLTGWIDRAILNITPADKGLQLTGVALSEPYNTFISSTVSPGYVWKDYNGTGSGFQLLYNDGSASNNKDINCSIPYYQYFVFGCNDGVISSYSSAGWTKFNGTGISGVWNNGTAIGVQNITNLSITPTGNRLVVAGGSGRVANFDGQWTNYDGSTVPTGQNPLFPYNNSEFLGTALITTSAKLGNSIYFSTNTGVINSINNTNNAFTKFYTTPLGAVIPQLLTGFDSSGYLYAYKYEENGLYLINPVNNIRNKGYILDDVNKEVVELNCRYAYPQYKDGYTRHIITETPRVDGSIQKSLSLIGFIDFKSFIPIQVYPSEASVPTSSILQSQVGWNYVDLTYRVVSSVIDIYNYVAPQFENEQTNYFKTYQGNTNNLINAYSKLTNYYGVPSTKPFEIRLGWFSGVEKNTQGTTVANIPGVQTYISCAILDNLSSDTLGTLLTNFGNFDDTYTPMVYNDDTIMYKFNGVYYIVKIAETLNVVEKLIQKINSRIYKINTISPLNIVDSNSDTLELGSIDYNGRMIYTNNLPPLETSSTKIVSVINDEYSSSIDIDERLTQLPIDADDSNIKIIGYRLPNQKTFSDYAVYTYVDGEYKFSTLNDGSEVIQDVSAQLYSPNNYLPIPIGSEYYFSVANTNGSTLFLDKETDQYLLGNEIKNENWTIFNILGQDYIFDGNYIYLVELTNGVLATNPTKLALAAGLTYITVTPTNAIFLSSFDNSIYSYNGGRTLEKTQRFTIEEPIIKGLFSIRDNTLLLETANKFLFMRDGIITRNNKPTTSVPFRLYDTYDGLQIGNDRYKYRYTFQEIDDTSTVVPLKLTTSYFGTELNDKSIIRSVVITIYSENRLPFSAKVTHDSFDQDKWYSQNETFNVRTSDINDKGYTRIRLQPRNQRNLANSFTIESDNKILVLDVNCIYENEQNAVIASRNSK